MQELHEILSRSVRRPFPTSNFQEVNKNNQSHLGKEGTGGHGQRIKNAGRALHNDPTRAVCRVGI